MGILFRRVTGMVNDMYAESSNDGADYAVLAGQEDFDLF